MSNYSEGLPPAASKRRQSTQSSLRKRDSIYSRRLQTSTAFSLTTKNKIAELDDAKYCWHCGANPIDICHVISQGDKKFKDLVAQGILPFSSLSHIDNGIPLCPLCHRNFDDIFNPGFIFIPTDLPFFITFEQDDYERRTQMAQATGRLPGRTCPTAQDYFDHQLKTGVVSEDTDTYGGLYARYTLRDYLQKLGQPPFKPGPEPFVMPKPWHDAPTAAIRRAFLVIADPLLKGIPADVVTDLYTLIRLYGRDLSDMDMVERGTPGGESTGLAAPGSSSLGGHELAAVAEGSTSLDRMTGAAPSATNNFPFREIYGDLDPYDQRSKPVPTAFPTAVEANKSVSISLYGSGPQLEETGTHSDMVVLDDGTQLSIPWKWGPTSTSEMVAEFYQYAGKPGKVYRPTGFYQRAGKPGKYTGPRDDVKKGIA